MMQLVGTSLVPHFFFQRPSWDDLLADDNGQDRPELI